MVDCPSNIRAIMTAFTVRHSLHIYATPLSLQVLCKISNQAAMKESLAREKREAESRAATLRQEWESLGKQFQDLKVDIDWQILLTTSFPCTFLR